MKTAVFALLVFGEVGTIYGQGAVNFSNQSTALSSPPDRLVRFTNSTLLDPSFTDGTPVFTNASNAGLRAQLFYGATTATEGSLVAVSEAPSSFRSGTSPGVGCWFGGFRIIPDIDPAQDVLLNLQVRVWDISLASSYADAEAAVLSGSYSGLIGKSQVFRFWEQAGIIAPGVENMSNFQGFYVSIIPEPSSCVLCLLGFFVMVQALRLRVKARSKW